MGFSHIELIGHRIVWPWLCGSQYPFLRPLLLLLYCPNKGKTCRLQSFVAIMRIHAYFLRWFPQPWLQVYLFKDVKWPLRLLRFSISTAYRRIPVTESVYCLYQDFVKLHYEHLLDRITNHIAPPVWGKFTCWCVYVTFFLFVLIISFWSSLRTKERKETNTRWLRKIFERLKNIHTSFNLKRTSFACLGKLSVSSLLLTWKLKHEALRNAFTVHMWLDVLFPFFSLCFVFVYFNLCCFL